MNFCRTLWARKSSLGWFCLFLDTRLAKRMKARKKFWASNCPQSKHFRCFEISSRFTPATTGKDIFVFSQPMNEAFCLYMKSKKTQYKFFRLFLSFSLRTVVKTLFIQQKLCRQVSVATWTVYELNVWMLIINVSTYK